MLLTICIILAISTIGFGLFSFFLVRKMFTVIKVFSEFTNSMAVYAEVMTVNDTDKDTVGKKQLGFRIIYAFDDYCRYWKNVPVQVSSMINALKKKYGEKPHVVTVIID